MPSTTDLIYQCMLKEEIEKLKKENEELILDYSKLSESKVFWQALAEKRTEEINEIIAINKRHADQCNYLFDENEKLKDVLSKIIFEFEEGSFLHDAICKAEETLRGLNEK